MLNEVVKGIRNALKAEFGWETYQNDIRQGLDEPCFFVVALQSSKDDLLGRRAILHMPLDVHYFPRCGRNNAAMQEVALRMLCVLKFITLENGDIVHGVSMSWQVEDNVLHFFVTYNMPVRFPTKPIELMQTLNLDQNTAKGE